MTHGGCANQLVVAPGAGPGRGRKSDDKLPVRDQVPITPQRNTSLAGFDRRWCWSRWRCWRWAW